MRDYARCRGITQKGEPCQVASKLSTDGLCIWHDPERAVEAELARQRGRTNRNPTVVPRDGPPSAPRSLSDCAEFASWVLHKTAAGEMDHQRSRTLTSNVREVRISLEKRDLARQLAKLEKKVRAAIDKAETA